MAGNESNNYSEFKEHIKSGKKVWFIARNEKGELETFGSGGDVIYAGYQSIGTSTYLIFERVIGSGKKAKLEAVTFHADDVRRIGVIEEVQD